MNIKILLLAFSASAFVSCSTAYKSGQTPDDVYYSPLKVHEENDDNREEEKYDREERQIVMETRDRRWRDLDRDYDYDHRYDPYRYSCTCGYYYNPYYYPGPVYLNGYTFSNPKNTTPRMTSLKSYSNTSLPVYNTKAGTPVSSSTRAYNNSNRNTGYTRQIFTNGNTNTNSNSGSSSGTNNSRTYSPSSSSSNSSGTKSGSISRPAKRGN